MKDLKIIASISKTYNKMSHWGKILLWITIFLIVVVNMRSWKPWQREAFTQNDTLIVKSGNELYDDFYVNIYDYLVYNNVKNSYEVGEIIQKTGPTQHSIILDVGSGTGHHVASLASKGYNVTGVDQSSAMVKKAKENYPECQFIQGDVLNNYQFEKQSFTHILCLYFTIYYFPNKNLFLENCYQWLRPGGYLLLHLVERNQFDPILPPGNPLIYVSPQRYAKERITTTKLVFDDMTYSSTFDLNEATNIATFDEKFKHKETGKIRKNQHTLYMDTDQAILTMAQNVGFILGAQIDLIKCQYEYQYVYVLQKPN